MNGRCFANTQVRAIDVRASRCTPTLLSKYGIIVKMSEKRHFNGFRLSTHVLNTQAHVDTALQALRSEIA